MTHNIAYFIFLMDFMVFYWIDCNYDVQDMREIERDIHNYCDFVLLSSDFD